MFQLKTLLYYATIAIVIKASPPGCEEIDGLDCRLQDPPNQCGALCLSALMPLIDHIAEHQEQWKTCNLDHNLTKAKFQEIQGHQRDIQKQIESQNTSLTDSWKKIIAEDIENKINGLELKMEGQLSVLHKELSSIKTSLMNISSQISILKRFKRIGSRYLHIEETDERSWTGALSACQEMGGNLTSIINEKDFSAIVSQLTKGVKYRVGISDRAKKGEFISVSSGKRAPFLKWKPGEPVYDNTGQHCINVHNGGMWVDSCTHNMKYICEPNKNIF
ncbi:accessory gland protein Acp29AB [Drosophila mauritiana]|uniref:Accessory gland protein Acp29AB n=1 Tax=Drosophila mauritiana TaxID=7226 RepID=A0A6P8KVI8_DROMA|nr:accessory gland protein Acp29AB [Drosophila mauritiana]